MITFRLLGPVSVAGIGDLGPAKQRCVLAALLVSAGRPVSIDEAMSRVWGDSAPKSAREQFYIYISRLRSALAGIATIVRGPAGYTIDAPADSIDVFRFESLVRKAAAAADPATRSDLLHGALQLWRGEPLSGLTGAWVDTTRNVWHHRHLDALVERIEADLALGRHAEIHHELTALTHLHPLHERLAGQLLLATYRLGDQHGALEVFQRTRARLRDELGLEPGPELQQLHTQVLRQHPALKPQAAAEPPVRHIPRMLPYDLPDFTGRTAELGAVEKLAEQRVGPTVAVITGMAGVGKTSAAVHVAHRLADRYPDGQLFIDMHGFTSERDPIPPGVAAYILLQALDVAPERIPADHEARAALWRQELAGRRVCVVLDNAAEAAQIRALIPSVGDSLVLATSRRRLASLDGAESVSVDVLTPEDAAGLFTRIIRNTHPHSDPATVEELVRLCGYLPLAIRITAARLAKRPQWTATDLLERLRREHGRMSELVIDERDVAAAFTLSYDSLNPRQQLLFRLQSVHPGHDIDVHAAAALADITAAEAEPLLEDLLDHHLLSQRRFGRYHLHDLLREFADATSRAADSEAERDAAFVRLCDFYLNTAAAAMDRAYPDERHLRPRLPDPPPWTLAFATGESAREWINEELADIVAVATAAFRQQLPGYTIAFSTTLFRHLDSTGRHAEAHVLHQQAVEAARATDDRPNQAACLNALALVFQRTGKLAEAVEIYRRALALFIELGNEIGQARVLGNLGHVASHFGQFEDAISHARQAEALYSKVDDHIGRATAWNNIGVASQRLGRQQEAVSYHMRALALFRRHDNLFGQAHSMSCLGTVLSDLGRYREALPQFESSMAIFRKLDNHRGEGIASNGRGLTHMRLGQFETAAEDFQHALALFSDLGELAGVAEAQNGLAEVELALGHTDRSRALHQAALAAATKISDLGQQARALAGLGHVEDRLGQRRGAAEFWQRALNIFAMMDGPSEHQLLAWREP